MLRPRPGFDLFLASVLVLFLELACIRWFPAHVIFLSFFTNTMLLASFVGMSIGCLLARRPTRQIAFTPVVLLVAVLAGLMVERFREKFQKMTNVGNQDRPDVVFFGAEAGVPGELEFQVPVELMAGAFFVLVAAALVGPGQELGRAFNRMTDRTKSYTLNLLGSLFGIAAFALFSQLELQPVVWFAAAGGLIAYFLLRPEAGEGRPRPLVPLGALALAVGVTALTSFSGVKGFTDDKVVKWSPYYRIDLDPKTRIITTNQTGHQQMIPLADPAPAPYDLPYLFQRQLGRPQFERILVIGAGSGNDLSRALHWCGPNAKIDAVDIDPVIMRFGRKHPDDPYDDPRVTRHLNDGRNFLRQAAEGTYDLVVFALVDSLVLHSGYSSIRLESFLFTEDSFRDVKRALKPTGTCAVYNFFRQGWLMARLRDELRTVFAADPVALIDPPAEDDAVPLDAFVPGSRAVFFAGAPEVIDPLREKFAGGAGELAERVAAPLPAVLGGAAAPGLSADALRERFDARAYWVPGRAPMRQGREGQFASRFAPPLDTYDGAANEPARDLWKSLRLTTLADPPPDLQPATDDWPFLYVRRPGIPDLTWTGAGLMLGLSLALWAAFHFLTPRGTADPTATPDRMDPAEWGLFLRAFFMGGGFMLIETKAVVQMALLFGSTWTVNTVVFAAILVMAVVGNLFAGRVKPARLEPYYLGLFVAIAVGLVVPLQWFLGLNQVVQVVLACLMVFAPVAFAGVIFPTTFARTRRPDWFFAANVAGALVGGLAENASMVLGFQYLLLVAAGFYALSAAFGGKAAK